MHSRISPRLCQFYDSRISMPSPKQQVPFCSSGYKKASQICYTLAMELLNGIVRNTYPESIFLPSVQKLAEEKQASVITVRRALAVLNGIGTVRSVNGVGTQVRPVAEVTEHCDFSQPIVHERLRDFAQSLQLLTLSCKEVFEITVDSLSSDTASQFEDRLLLLRRIGQDELAALSILELTTHFAPYAAIQTVYAELFQMLEAAILRELEIALALLAKQGVRELKCWTKRQKNYGNQSRKTRLRRIRRTLMKSYV